MYKDLHSNHYSNQPQHQTLMGIELSNQSPLEAELESLHKEIVVLEEYFENLSRRLSPITRPEISLPKEQVDSIPLPGSVLLSRIRLNRNKVYELQIKLQKLIDLLDL